MVVQHEPRRFSVDEYHRMAEVGLLGEDESVELIEGEVLRMSPVGRCHAAVVAQLVAGFGRLLGDLAIVWPQNPVRLDQSTEVQPDVVLLEPSPDFYRANGVEPRDVLLLVEVADSSVEYDRQVKVPLYARAGISEVWLVDLGRQLVTVHRRPGPDGYELMQVARPGEQVSPAAFPGLQIDVAEIVG